MWGEIGGGHDERERERVLGGGHDVSASTEMPRSRTFFDATAFCDLIRSSRLCPSLDSTSPVVIFEWAANSDAV